MPYNAFIDIGEGKPIQISNCSYSVYRATNVNGEPNGDVDSGKISFSLIGMDKSPFWQWAATRDMKKNGKILFKDTREKDKDRKVLIFEDAYAVEFQEAWGNGSDSMETVTLSAKKITLNEKSVENEWAEAT
jgi:hypothetical protein